MTEELNVKMIKWFTGNEEAVDFALRCWSASQLWDDLCDGESVHADNKFPNEFITWLAFDKEYHPFFARNANVLRPAMIMTYLNWQAANKLEHAPDIQKLQKSYVLRAGIYSLFHLIAWICGGHNHADDVAEEIWSQYGETLDGLSKELGVENA